MPIIEHFFHLVTTLPMGANVLIVDQCGKVHTYLRRDADLEDIATDLAWCRTSLAEHYCSKDEEMAAG